MSDQTTELFRRAEKAERLARQLRDQLKRLAVRLDSVGSIGQWCTICSRHVNSDGSGHADDCILNQAQELG